jgi:hypothetical protein
MSKLKLTHPLEDLALDLGARVDYADGKVFNTSGRAGAARLVHPKPDAAPAASTSNEQLLQAITKLLEQRPLQNPAPVDVRLPEIVLPPHPAPTVVVEKAAPVSWSFEFERNANGTLKRIVAKPIKE